jgi:hypothetical protein
MVRVFISIVILKAEVVSYLSAMGWNQDSTIEAWIISLAKVEMGTEV